MGSPETSAGMTWLIFALMTVVTWGVYGVLLHAGQLGMGDPALGRYKAFLWVGIAYFVTAVLAPLVALLRAGGGLSFEPSGILWAFLAGVAGAAGAFCVLLAFGARGTPSVVMSIVFAGAPVVNALVALALHPSKGWRWQFILGIVLAAAGGCLVTLYRPAVHSPTAAAQASTRAPR
jgi:drug/metabolite transporter (DMT)-like permease